MRDKIQDVIMIGAGPSALTAAIYTAREDIDTLIFEKSVVGGVVAIIDKVENYPGFPDGVEGSALAEQLAKQAKRFGAKIEMGDVTSISVEGDVKFLTIDGNLFKAKTVLIATGRGYNKIGIPGESEYFGHGVHYCATCDGAFYNNKQLVVVGGSNAAIQESIYLTRFATHIDLMVRSTIKASKILQRDLQKYIDDGKITVHLGATIDEIIGNNGHVTAVRTTKDNASMTIETDGIFIFVGLKPNTQFLTGSGVELDEIGFIETDVKLQTNIPGIFASGDVRSGATMQIASAVGEGATVAYSIREYLHNL
jgi:Thioredoxin reductase